MQIAKAHPQRPFALAVAVVAFGLLAAGSARAGLGEPAASVQQDHLVLHATAAQLTPSSRFVRHTLRTPEGALVHEFVGLGGRVFAVSWSGHSLPDLKTLLGAHYDEYAAEAAKRHASHHVFTMATDQLVLGITRLPRGFTGAAHVPALLPAGVSAEDIR